MLKKKIIKNETAMEIQLDKCLLTWSEKYIESIETNCMINRKIEDLKFTINTINPYLKTRFLMLNWSYLQIILFIPINVCVVIKKKCSFLCF